MAGVVLGIAGPALACSFAPPSVEQNFRMAGAAFVGTVTETTAVASGSSESHVRIRVDAVLKGVVGAEVVIDHNNEGSSCGFRFRVGDRRIFFTGRVVGGRTTTSLITMSGSWNADAVQELSRRYADAVEPGRRATLDRPNDIAAFLALAAIQEEWGDVDAAAQTYERAAAIDAWHPRVLLDRARRALNDGRPVDAMVALVHARAADPASAEIRFFFDEARRLTGDTEAPAVTALAGIRIENLRYQPQVGSIVGPNPRWSGRDFSRGRIGQLEGIIVDLREARLIDATVAASFAWIWHLEGADLTRARLVDSTFDRVYARAARMDHAVLRNVAGSMLDLSGAIAPGLLIERARVVLRFRDGDFSGARFVGVDSQARGSDGERARFDGATFQDVVLYGIDLTDASFVGAVATRSRFIRAVFERTRFDGADLAGSDFTGSTFQEVDLGAARIAGARFTNARLLNVDLSRADLFDVDLRAARYDCDTRFPSGFMPMHRGAIPIDAACRPANGRFVFDGADFSGTEVDLSDLDLSGASFRGVVFGSPGDPYGARLSGSNLRGADFTGSVGVSVYAVIDLRGADFTGATDAWGFYAGRGEPAKDLTDAVFRGVRFHPGAFAGFEGDRPADLSQALMEGAILICTRLDQQPDMRARWVAWIRALEPRRRGIILGEGCDRVPELADVR